MQKLVFAFLLILCGHWNYSLAQDSNIIEEFKQVQEMCGDLAPDSVTSVSRSQERLNECIYMVEEFLRSFPHVAKAHLLLAKLYWNKALTYASEKERELLIVMSQDESQKAVELAPKNIEALKFFAFVLPQERGGEAISALQKITELDPTDYEAHWSLGMRMLNAGRVEEAMKLLQKAVVLMTVPEILNEKWHNLMGILSERGLYKEALETSEAILKKKLAKSDFSRRLKAEIETEVMWLRGVILAERDQTLERGIQLMKEAIARIEKPDFSMGKRWQLADLLKARGRYREALQWYESLPPMQVIEEIIRDLRKKIEQQEQQN